jgi:hypothetical protein
MAFPTHPAFALLQEQLPMNSPDKPLRAFVTIIGLWLLAGATAAAQQPATFIPMAPGVVVGSGGQEPVAWVADDRGRVAAIDLDDGSVRWRGPAEGLPLALVDQQLVVLGRPQGAGRISLLLLDPDTGASRGGIVGDLPEGVLATPDPKPNRRFAATADSHSGSLRVRWSYAEWPLRGALLERDPGSGDERRELAGAVVVDFASNRVVTIDARGVPSAPAPDLTASERLPSLDGTQFRAADDLTVLVSSAVTDAVLGSQWRWSLHERSSGRALGNLTLPYAQAPFLLRGTQLLWRSEPLTQLKSADDYETLPARLVAHELGSGRELWSVALFDLKFRGAPPP